MGRRPTLRELFGFSEPEGRTWRGHLAWAAAAVLVLVVLNLLL